jgi:hypothetical protein
MSRFENGTKVIVIGVRCPEELATIWGRLDDDLFRVTFDKDGVYYNAYAEDMRVLTKLEKLLLGLDK